MPNTMTFRRGDTVLVPFPFTDRTGKKKRPAVVVVPDEDFKGVVVSADYYNAAQSDLIVAEISGNFRSPLPADEYEIRDWGPSAAKLLKPSVFRPKLATLDHKLVIRPLGRVSDRDMHEIDARLRMALGL